MALIVVTRLGELLAERGMTQHQFAERSGIRVNRVSAIVNNSWTRLDREELARILEVLHVTAQELLVAYEEDVFFGARHDRDAGLTIHSACNSLDVGTGDPMQGMNRLAISFWDHTAAEVIFNHAAKLRIPVTLVTHTPLDRPEPGVASVAERFPRSSHVIVGSQLASDLSERVVCLMYQKPAFDGTQVADFPYIFVWNRRRNSSFGVAAGGRYPETGIASTRTNKLVASRTYTEAGPGHDCALVVVYRIAIAPVHWVHGVRSERVIVVLAGHGGLGTLGAAQMLTDPASSAEFYPERPNVPRVRVVSVEYAREPNRVAPNYDMRRLERVTLVAED